MMFRIARSRDGGKTTHYDLYEMEVRKGMTVLDALFEIQDKMDPSLSFRYSCRGAVCGSCAMLIDKEPRLACKTQINKIKENDMKLKPFPAITQLPEGWDQQNEILIEPLPSLPILKDLIVDMDPFYKALETLKLWVTPTEGDKPRRQDPEDQKRIERYVGCIMCALCYGSCPVNAKNQTYVGPAALAKGFRFIEDTRVQDKNRFIESIAAPNGAMLCDLVMNCVRACPKGVAPGGAIRKIKQDYL
ncbi:MAG: succinate dehydrogenase/fumarate reductase iron-sulfur subunit [Candidatus Thorarchaeota archaeon]|nr:succinate dehydrogenase/fumarate reductase iron-sulfur subunit [Candidatus Thorarchaeota archaeon]